MTTPEPVGLDDLPLTSVTVLLQVPGGHPVPIDAIVVDRGFCAKAQIGAGLIEIGDHWLDLAERMCGGGGGCR